MTTSEMGPDIHLGTGAMALDCLPADEAAEFAEHLATCESCPAELVGFVETAALLGAAAAETAPPSLRARVLSSIREIPQLPPLLHGDVDRTNLGRHRSSDETPAEESGPQPTINEPPVDLPSNVIPMRHWYRRPQALLAAAAAVVIIAVGVVIFARSGNSAPNVAVAPCVESASDLQTRTPAAGDGVVVYSASCAQATVTPTDLKALPAGQIYQLWAVKGTDTANARSLGVLTPNANGSYTPAVVTVQQGENLMAITAEPGPNGSKEPTTSPIWATTL